MIITGPSSPVQLRSLTIGSLTSGIAELRTQPTGQITINDLSDPEASHETLLVEATGKLTIDGVVNVLGGTTTNVGKIVLDTGVQFSFQLPTLDIFNPGDSATMTNFGEIVLDTGAQLSGSNTPDEPPFLGGLINHGVIRGNGTIDNVLFNDVGGEVRVSTGQRLLFSGFYNANSGTTEVIGGEVEFTEIPYA